MTYTTLLLEFGKERATIKLNRPDKRQRHQPQMIAELFVGFDEIEKRRCG